MQELAAVPYPVSAVTLLPTGGDGCVRCAGGGYVGVGLLDQCGLGRTAQGAIDLFSASSLGRAYGRFHKPNAVLTCVLPLAAYCATLSPTPLDIMLHCISYYFITCSSKDLLILHCRASPWPATPCVQQEAPWTPSPACR